MCKLPQLRNLRYDNQEFTLWHDGAKDIIKAALNSDDLSKFASWRPIHVRGMFPEDVYQRDYLDRLIDYETALKSIIQKYETLGIELDAKTGTIEPSGAMVGKTDIIKVFISHGKAESPLAKLEKFMSAFGVDPIIVKDQPNLDRTTDRKVEDCLNEADFVIILATGDDEVVGEKTKRPRQNIMHEIGLAQKTHPGKIIYLLEEGAEFPSNVGPKVYERFNRQSMDSAFTAIVREMRKLGFL